QRVLQLCALLVAALLPVACDKPSDSRGGDAAKVPPVESKPGDLESQMQAGIEALYTRHDPQAAATAFRKVLELNPMHYGATFQLATALDAAGKREEAHALWGQVLKLAEAAHDQPTIDTARARLAATS